MIEYFLEGAFYVGVGWAVLDSLHDFYLSRKLNHEIKNAKDTQRTLAELIRLEKEDLLKKNFKQKDKK